MNSKKAITLLVLATLIMSMVPAVPFASAELNAGNVAVDNDDVAGQQATGEKGQTIICTGAADSVSSGYEVNIYWDKIQAWDGEKGLLNTTEVDDDGGFEIWFEVPEAPIGGHNIWYTATDQSTTARDNFDVLEDCDISSSSGLADSKIYVDLWGFDDNEDAGILLVDNDGVAAPNTAPMAMAQWNLWKETAEVADAAATGKVATDFTLNEHPVYAPGLVGGVNYRVEFSVDGTLEASYTTAGGGTFVDENGNEDFTPGTSTINLYTGAVALDWGGAIAGTALTVDYWAYYGIEGEALDTYDGGAEYDGTLANAMVEPGTVTITATGGQVYEDDDSDGKLYNDAGPAEKVGTIDYITGEWTLDFDGTTAGNKPQNGAMTIAYEYFDEVADQLYILSSSGLTDDLGTWENKRVTIPNAGEQQYYVYGMDGDGNMAFDDYAVGAIITLSEDSGPVGSKIDIDGAGFTPAATCTVTVGGVGAHIIDSAGTVDDVDNDGEFSFSIIIPQVPDEDDYDIVVTAGGDTPSAEFEVTDLASVSVSPDFGPQGSTVTVSGENYPMVKDTEVEIWLTTTGGADVIQIDSADTAADGTFSVDVTVPTENDDSYKIEARVEADADGAFNIDDDTDFRIGTILVLLSKDDAVVGDRIVLTGNGFTDNGEWNATFGDVTLFSEEQASATGLLKVDGDTPEFFVPQLPVGDYVITVWDSDAEIMIETDFTITTYTTLEFGTVEAPNEFNVTIDGWYWPEVDGALNANADIEFVLWNETDEWDMEVKQLWDHDDNALTARQERVAILNATGFFNDAWWMVPEDDVLSKGTYHINATIEADNDQSYEMFLDFTVGDVYAAVSARKATFRVGDTVNFNVEHSFGGQAAQDVDAGQIVVYDPSGDEYWVMDEYLAGDWNKMGEYYKLTYASQTASGNPCVLLDDAPLGEWSFEWEDEGGDVVEEGVFTVEDSEANVVSGQVADLADQIDDLTADLSGVTEDFDDVKSDISGVLAVAEQAVAAANAATEAVNAVATQANNAGAAAEAAQVAAENAADAASGLTTLVYGAIGAALVAALAAIVSLMQISRRIAG